MTGKYWPPPADAKAKQILREHAEDLYREAESVTHRAGAHVVTPRDVEVAAHIVRMRRGSSGAADVLMSVGTTIAGIGGGALVATAAEGSSGYMSADWVGWASIGMLLAGSVLSAIGGTLKWREGR